MKVNFELQPDAAKVWIYQADKELNEADLEQIFEIGNFFLNQWESHNLPVNGSLDVHYNRFVVISAFSDEDAMCGRAQDEQMRLMKELEEVVGCSFTNRMLVFYEDENAIKSFHFSELSDLLSNNKISVDTQIFNSLVNKKADFEKEWKVALKDSWLNQFA